MTDGETTVGPFDVVTIFPAMVEAFLADGVVGRARIRGLLDIAVHDLRSFTTDRHHVVDDVPFGGGPGMVMKAEPFYVCRLMAFLQMMIYGFYPVAAGLSKQKGLTR